VESFRYEAPRTVDEAVALLAKGDGDARVLAGGTDLIVQMRTGVRHPRLIVDVKRIPETLRIEFDGAVLRLGAAVPCAAIREHRELRRVFPGFLEALELIGSEQIQGRASVGGNVCNASPAADTVPALIALGAECVIAGPRRTRSVPVEAFATGPGETVLETGELLVELRIPAPGPASASPSTARGVAGPPASRSALSRRQPSGSPEPRRPSSGPGWKPKRSSGRPRKQGLQPDRSTTFARPRGIAGTWPEF
jgi:carbon-monoxide dehydrogenase medium subunit